MDPLSHESGSRAPLCEDTCCSPSVPHAAKKQQREPAAFRGLCVTTPGAEAAGVGSDSGSRTHDTGSRNEHELRPAGAHPTSTPSQPWHTQAKDRQARALLQPPARFPSAPVCPSLPYQLSLLSWVRAGARRPQLSLPPRPTPPHPTGLAAGTTAVSGPSLASAQGSALS